MDDPFFPPPPPKGQVYREPGRSLGASERGAVSDSITRADRVVVRRPDPVAEHHVERPRRLPGATENLGSLARSERAFWNRTSSPRPVGAIFALLGGGGVWLSLRMLGHGGHHVSKATILGPLFLCWGVFVLVTGHPLDLHGRRPTWWTLGFVLMTLLGAAGGITLVAALKHG